MFENLIGKEFKRNKYGLSIWTDKIKKITFKYEIIDRTTKKILVYVIGESNENNWYDLDEIVLVNQKLNWMEEAALNKRELFNKNIIT